MGVHGPAVRRTVFPTRTTRFSFPPGSGISEPPTPRLFRIRAELADGGTSPSIEGCPGFSGPNSPCRTERLGCGPSR